MNQEVKPEANATLYLENAVVLDVRDVTREDGIPSWMVRATVTRTSKQGFTFTNTYALFCGRRPEVEAGWIINASGYLQVKPHLDHHGEPRAYVNLQAARIQSAVPGDESTGMEETRPWGSSTRETW